MRRLLAVLTALFALMAFRGCDTGPPYGSDGPHSGWSAYWVGDVDGDRTPDIVLATAFEPRSPASYGALRVISGATSRTLRTLFLPDIIHFTESSVGEVGDIDGDGRGEVWWEDGYYRIVVGPGIEGPSQRVLEKDRGRLVDSIGDVDGDGSPELLIGGFLLQPDEAQSLSAVSIRTGRAIWTLTRPPSDESTDNPFAWKGCVVGDVDLDHVADAAIIDEQEQILIVSGRTGATLADLHQRVYWILGSLAPVGDVDGDHVPDLAVSEGENEPLRVISCSDGRELLSLWPSVSFFRVFSPGDVDGDGRLDIAWSGMDRVEVLRTADGRRILALENVTPASGSADYDGDGCADMLVTRNIRFQEGERGPDDLWRKGKVEIVSGRDGTVLRVWDESVLKR